MRLENKTRRQMQIEQAAYDVLSEKGYGGTSMLSIAKRAKASNETLYNWYGDKRGLFRALVERNAEDVLAYLEANLAGDGSAVDTLSHLGPLLLKLLTGDRAVALNQAAAADASGELGEAIASAGRETVLPVIQQTLATALERGELNFEDPAEAADIYISLLVGDLQIRRVIGRMPEPDEDFITRRSKRAIASFLKLMSE